MSLTILLLDTETNGLPKNRFAPPSEFDAYPAILQLSWAIYRVDGLRLTPVRSRDIGIALDPAIPWDTGAAKIHGLCEAEARRGTPSADALTELALALHTVDVVVAHNLAFDKPVIRAAGYRTGVAELRQLWPTTIKEFCTMKATRDLVQIPATAAQAKYAELGQFKAPRLNELYAWLYGHVYDISGATLHSAKSDTHCLAQCITGLLRKGHLTVQDGNLFVRALLPLLARSPTEAS
jgi:DNA polymerase III epsilon subunit-like protein